MDKQDKIRWFGNVASWLIIGGGFFYSSNQSHNALDSLRPSLENISSNFESTNSSLDSIEKNLQYVDSSVVLFTRDLHYMDSLTFLIHKDYSDMNSILIKQNKDLVKQQYVLKEALKYTNNINGALDRINGTLDSLIEIKSKRSTF